MRKLEIIRRLVGCFYCGYPCPGDVCPYCTDLPVRDPLVAKVRLPLSEQERFEAVTVRRVTR
jgi:hypothetical protein